MIDKALLSACDVLLGNTSVYVRHAFVLRHVVCIVSSYCVVQLYVYILGTLARIVCTRAVVSSSERLSIFIILCLGRLLPP